MCLKDSLFSSSANERTFQTIDIRKCSTVPSVMFFSSRLLRFMRLDPNTTLFTDLPKTLGYYDMRISNSISLNHFYFSFHHAWPLLKFQEAYAFFFFFYTIFPLREMYLQLQNITSLGSISNKYVPWFPILKCNRRHPASHT